MSPRFSARATAGLLALAVLTGCASALDARPVTPGWQISHPEPPPAREAAPTNFAEKELRALLARHDLADTGLKVSGRTVVYFPANSDVLDTDAARQLTSWRVRQPIDAVFILEGYTDPTGNLTDNLALSERRALTVQSYLPEGQTLALRGFGPLFITDRPEALRRVVAWALHAPQHKE